MQRLLAAATLVALAASLAACSGGGGTGPASIPAALPSPATVAVAPPPSATPVVAPTPVAAPAVPSPVASASPAAAAAIVTGRVVDLPYDGTPAAPGYSQLPAGPASPGAPVAGAIVVVGPQLIAGATPPPALPAGFVRATTDANGAFAIANPGAGRYAISIFAPPPHDAALHQDLVLASAGSVPAGLYYMTVPNAGERAWLAQTNADRTLYGAPPVGIDEAALEAARYWSAFMRVNGYFEHCIPASLCETGSTVPPPANYGPQDVDPQHRFRYFHGFSGASEGENIAAGFAAWQNADAAFMAEAAACPGGQPANCAFAAATGHFLNIVDAQYVWAGFGVTPTPSGATWYDEEFSNVYSVAPTTAALPRQRLSGPAGP